MKRATLILLFLTLFLAAPTSVALAASRNDNIIKEGDVVDRDVTVYGDNLVVEEGAIINGNVFVYGGNAVLAGTINGDVSVFGGNSTLSGDVTGAIVVFGGNLAIKETAALTGDCVSLGGNVSGASSIGVTCSSIPGPEIISTIFSMPRKPEVPSGPIHFSRRSPVSTFFSGLAQAVGRSLMLGILALVIAAILPDQITRMANAIRQNPATVGTVGVLTAVAVPSLAALLALISAILTLVCIGLLGFPLVFILLAGLGAAALVGWISVGSLVGERLAEPLRLNNRTLPVTTAVGTIALTLVAGILMIGPFAFGGWLVNGIIFSVGLGAAALTQFGAKAYPRPAKHASAKVGSVLETLPDDEE
jgi:hypothetical protein